MNKTRQRKNNFKKKIIYSNEAVEKAKHRREEEDFENSEFWKRNSNTCHIKGLEGKIMATL